eukprot:COSAG02_NODE_971_length_15551_cov_4.415157_23_plen_79_part_00
MAAEVFSSSVFTSSISILRQPSQSGVAPFPRLLICLQSFWWRSHHSYTWPSGLSSVVDAENTPPEEQKGATTSLGRPI